MPSTIGDKLIAGISKEFGEKSIYYANDMPPIEVVPSGSLALDFAIGVGGMPMGRVVEFAGAEGSGKTTLSLLVAKQVLARYPERALAFFDLEHKLSTEWMAKLLGEETMDRVLIVAPDTIEQTSELFKRLVKSEKVAMVIVDSIGAAPTNQAMDDSRNIAEKADSMGGNAKGVSAFARLAANFSAKYDCLTIGINQVRDDTKSRHGNLLSTPGGHAWKHACILRVEVRRGYEKYHVKEHGEERLVGFDVRAKVHKNQLGGDEGRVAEWRFFTTDTEQFGPMGVDTIEECVRLASATGVMTRAGAYYRSEHFPDGQVQGRDAVLKLVMADAEVRTKLVDDVLAALKADPNKIADVAPIESEEDEE